jgi:Mg2+ and Co2+ transporter CorA
MLFDLLEIAMEELRRRTMKFKTWLEKKKRLVSELMREAFRQYAARRVLRDVRKSVRQTVKRKGLKPADIERIVRK